MPNELYLLAHINEGYHRHDKRHEDPQHHLFFCSDDNPASNGVYRHRQFILLKGSNQSSERKFRLVQDKMMGCLLYHLSQQEPIKSSSSCAYLLLGIPSECQGSEYREYDRSKPPDFQILHSVGIYPDIGGPPESKFGEHRILLQSESHRGSFDDARVWLLSKLLYLSEYNWKDETTLEDIKSSVEILFRKIGSEKAEDLDKITSHVVNWRQQMKAQSWVR